MAKFTGGPQTEGPCDEPFDDPISRMASLDAEEWAALHPGGREPHCGDPHELECGICGAHARVLGIGTSRGPDPTVWFRLDCGHTVL